MNRKEITTKEDLYKVIELLEKTGITYWLDGGWGVDILAGKHTSSHRDIDINFDAKYMDRLLDVLLNLGYKICLLYTSAEYPDEESGDIKHSVSDHLLSCR